MADNNKQLTLLGFWPSMICMRVKVALAEKGISDYDCIEENLLNEEKSSLLLEMNPVHKKVPVLIHQGKPVCESMIIVEYIDQVWNKAHSSFLPSDPYLKSQVKFWADFVENKFFPASHKLWTTKDSAERETAKTDLIETLKTLEGELGDKCYFGGDDNFGFVDVALFPFYTWFDTYENIGCFSIEEECPKIVAWGKRCEQREAIKRSGVPEMHKVSEFILWLRKHRLGIQ